jgi:hypothetical protein
LIVAGDSSTVVYPQQPCCHSNDSKYHNDLEGSSDPPKAVRLPSRDSNDPCIHTAVDGSASRRCVDFSSVLPAGDDWMLSAPSTNVNPHIIWMGDSVLYRKHQCMYSQDSFGFKSRIETRMAVHEDNEHTFASQDS